VVEKGKGLDVNFGIGGNAVGFADEKIFMVCYQSGKFMPAGLVQVGGAAGIIQREWLYVELTLCIVYKDKKREDDTAKRSAHW
jgi:hypothetical protein